MDIDITALAPVRQIFAVEYSDAPQRPRVPIHVPALCKLDIVIAGCVNLLTADGQRIQLRPGIAALVPPLASHGYEAREHLVHTCVKFHLHPRYRFAVGRKVLLIDVPEHIQKTAHVCGQLSVDDPDAASLVHAAATYCVTFAMHAAAPQLSDDPPEDAAREPLAQVIHLVTHDPMQPWTVAQLAQMHHLSESQFTKRFRSAFRQSPQQFLQETRMIAAADRLISSTWSVKRIAELCGYANVHSFTRAFNRVIGLPPAGYRRRMQLMQV